MRWGFFLAAITVSRIAIADDAIPRARTLDEQGVKAFQSGRYRDAIQYFEEALKLGGPSSELWNVAKCHQKLDEPELADEALDRYLAKKDLSAGDRAEAEKLRKEIRTRASPVTVTSSPSQAKVEIDGRAVGSTPITVDVPPGEHKIAVSRLGWESHDEKVTAKWGRGIVVDAALDREGGNSTPTAHLRTRRFALEAGFGVSAGRLGTFGSSVYPLGFITGSFAIVDAEYVAAGVGIRFAGTGDAWGNTVGATTNGNGCMAMPLPATFSQAELGAHVLGVIGFKPKDRFRIGAEVGIGIVGTTSGGRVGGDVYDASCIASPGARPSFHVGFDVSYRVLTALRIVLRPIQFDVHPAYEGTRAVPIDASSAWMRLGLTAGVAVDL